MSDLYVVVKQGELSSLIILVLQLFPQEEQSLCFLRHLHPEETTSMTICLDWKPYRGWDRCYRAELKPTPGLACARSSCKEPDLIWYRYTYFLEISSLIWLMVVSFDVDIITSSPVMEFFIFTYIVISLLVQFKYQISGLKLQFHHRRTVSTWFERAPNTVHSPLSTSAAQTKLTGGRE